MYLDTDILLNDEERLLMARDLIADWENLKAKRLLEEILENDPLREEAYFLMGYLLEIRYSRFEQALEMYSVAYRLNAAYYENTLAFISLLNKSELFNETLKIFARMKPCDSAYKHELLIQKAIAYEKKGDLSSALTIVEDLRMATTCQSKLDLLETSKERIIRKMESASSVYTWS
jgi:tetratricopeptide (TPR) repeat protein